MDYDALKTRVNNLIKRNTSLTISFTRPASTTAVKQYDPASDTFKWYTSGVEVSEPTDTTYTGYVIETYTSEYFKAKGYVKESDRTFITNGVPRINRNEVVTIDGTTYTAYRIRAVNPGGTDVLYRISVRV